MSLNNGGVNAIGVVPDTPDRLMGSASSCTASEGTVRKNLESHWRSRFVSRRVLSDLPGSRVVQQLDFSASGGSSGSGSPGSEMSTEEEKEALHRRQGEILANPALAKGLRIAACNRVLGMPKVEILVDEQVRLLAGDPDVIRQLEAPDGSTRPTAETSRTPWEDDVPITEGTDLEDLEARTRRALISLEKNNWDLVVSEGCRNCLQMLASMPQRLPWCLHIWGVSLVRQYLVYLARRSRQAQHQLLRLLCQLVPQ